MTKEDFLKDMDNMSNHRELLWKALSLTLGPVVEFGSGYGSTPFLRQFCVFAGRDFYSYDSNFDWAQKTGSTYIDDWDKLVLPVRPSVLFLDHAPGERRKVDLKKYANIAEIIVIHDTEPTGAGDYQVRPLFSLFQHCADDPSDAAWTTILSNSCPL